jgi:alpha-beta hydrolase superfamily lysophospholipase
MNVTAMPDTHHTLPLEKGGQIRLIHLAGSRRISPPVILAHGTLSNGGTVRSFGDFLSGNGHDTWILEWGGHGSTTAPGSRQNFEAPAFDDLPRALAFVRETTAASQVFWVGHSGGGLLPLMHMARHPETQAGFAGLVTLGAQATCAALTPKHRFRALGLYLLTQVMGRTPRLTEAMGDEGEPTMLLAQWAWWNLRGQWRGRGKIDYLAGLGQIKIPCLTLAGTGDDIAPVEGCQAIFDALGSQDKTMIACGNCHGFSKDFSHGALVRGTAAETQIFPKIADWLAKRSNGTQK